MHFFSRMHMQNTTGPCLFSVDANASTAASADAQTHAEGVGPSSHREKPDVKGEQTDSTAVGSSQMAAPSAPQHVLALPCPVESSRLEKCENRTPKRLGTENRSERAGSTVRDAHGHGNNASQSPATWAERHTQPHWIRRAGNRPLTGSPSRKHWVQRLQTSAG